MYYRSLVAWSTCTKSEPDTREPFLLTKFATEPGIYFEKIGQMNQAESTWKMVITMDVKAIDQRYQQLQGYIEHTEDLCYNKPLIGRMRETCQHLFQIMKKENKQLAHR